MLTTSAAFHHAEFLPSGRGRHSAEVHWWPLAAGALDRVITAAIEGTTDQCFRRLFIAAPTLRPSMQLPADYPHAAGIRAQHLRQVPDRRHPASPAAGQGTPKARMYSGAEAALSS